MKKYTEIEDLILPIKNSGLIKDDQILLIIQFAIEAAYDKGFTKGMEHASQLLTKFEFENDGRGE